MRFQLNPQCNTWRKIQKIVPWIANSYGHYMIIKSLVDDRLSQVKRALDYARWSGKPIEAYDKGYHYLIEQSCRLEKLLTDMKERFYHRLYSVMLADDFLEIGEEWDTKVIFSEDGKSDHILKIRANVLENKAAWVKIEMVNPATIPQDKKSYIRKLKILGDRKCQVVIDRDNLPSPLEVVEADVDYTQNGVYIRGEEKKIIRTYYYLLLIFDESLDTLSVEVNCHASPDVGSNVTLSIKMLPTIPLLRKAQSSSQWVENAERFTHEVGELVKKFQSEVETFSSKVYTALSIDSEESSAEGEPVRITPDGRPSRILIGSYTNADKETAEPLGLDFGALGCWKMQEDGKLDLSYRERIRKFPPDKDRPQFWRYVLVEMPHNGMLVPIQEWWLDKYGDDPDIFMQNANGWRGFSGNRPIKGAHFHIHAPLNPWHPVARQYMAALLRANIYFFRKWPNIIGYCIGGEPSMCLVGNGAHESGHSRLAKEEFQRYLQKKFGTIDRLNSIWQSTYTDFSEIQPPPDINSLERKLHITPLSFEFQCFLRNKFAEVISFLYKTAKDADPDRPVLFWGGDGFGYMNTETRFAGDVWKIAQNVDVIEMHTNTDEREECERIYQYSIARLAQKSSWKKEYIWPWPRNNTVLDDDELGYYAVGLHSGWMHLAWGVQMLGYFLYCGSMKDRSWLGSPWYMDNAWDQRYYWGKYESKARLVNRQRIFRRCIGFLPVLKRYALKFSDILLHTQIVHPQIAIIQPTTSTINDFYFQHFVGLASIEAEQVHRLLYHCNYQYWYLLEEVILSGKEDLSYYKVLIIPGGMYFPDGLSERLLAWIKNGGTLIAIFPPDLYDCYGRPTGDLLRAVFGEFTESRDRENERWKIETLKPVERLSEGYIEGRYGKGRLVVFLRSIGEQSDIGGEMRSHFYKILTETVGMPLAWSEGTVFETILREDSKGNRYAIVLNWNYHDEVEGILHLKGEWKKIIDLGVGGGATVPHEIISGETVCRLRLPPGGGTILSLLSSCEETYSKKLQKGHYIKSVEDGLRARLKQVEEHLASLPEDRGRKAMAQSLAFSYLNRGDIKQAIEVTERAIFWLEHSLGKVIHPSREVPENGCLRVPSVKERLLFQRWTNWPSPSTDVSITKDGRVYARLLRLGRDLENLCLAVHVKDKEIFNPYEGRDLSCGDTVNFYFDLLNDAWNYWWGTVHYRYVFGANGKIWAGQLIGNSAAKIMEVPLSTQAEGRWINDVDGYILLAKIPLKELSLQEMGTYIEIGFNMEIRKGEVNNPHSPKYQVFWMPMESEHSPWKKWGLLVFPR